ncbi:MAG: NADH-quinone oxidoreductase subunit J [Alphaproteobacteria bacterium]|nr:MAG: NADH-quinone oxidoreductase subunit J [Alphaproteobacteria bacterium]
MTIQAIAFYFFAAITVGAGFGVIVARNPVHSVLFLILAFFSSAALFVLLGAEFLAMILVIVYVGAVAVLFLFVVMMLDINFAEMRAGFQQYLVVGSIVGLLLLAELIVILNAWTPGEASPVLRAAPTPSDLSNTEALGRILYTDYIYGFQAAGLILLVAMIGAIVLTHRRRPDVKRQNIAAQVARRRDEAVEVVKVESGEGI